MSQMIEAKQALILLGCDEKTLNGYITAGVIRAERRDGKLHVMEEDVDAVAAGQADDDVSVVLTADNDSLALDLSGAPGKTGGTGAIRVGTGAIRKPGTGNLGRNADKKATRDLGPGQGAGSKARSPTASGDLKLDSGELKLGSGELGFGSGEMTAPKTEPVKVPKPGPKASAPAPPAPKPAPPAPKPAAPPAKPANESVALEIEGEEPAPAGAFTSAIDLGEVEDGNRTNPGGPASASITFADDLEVISLDEAKTTGAHTQPVKMPAPAAPAKGGQPTDLGFTEENTAMLTVVDGGVDGPTDAGATTGQGDIDDIAGATVAPGGGSQVRVAYEEPEPPMPVWLVVTMAASLAFLALGVLPLHVISNWPHEGQRDVAGNTERGGVDGVWSSLAGTVAGFEVAADSRSTGEGDIKALDPQAEWRIASYRSDLKETGARRDSFIIEKISEDGKSAISLGGHRTYPIRQDEQVVGSQKITSEVVETGLEAK